MSFGLGFLFILGTALVGVTVTGNFNTFNPGDLISASQINENFTTLKTSIESIETVPPGAVMAFYRDTCPTGWTAADGTTSEDFGDGTRTVPDLRDRFVRGTGSATAMGTFYAGSNLNVWNQTQCHAATGCNGGATLYVHRVSVGLDNLDSGSFAWYSTLNDNGTSSASSGKIRPDNVGLLFCVKLP